MEDLLSDDMTSEIKDSILIDDEKNEMLEGAVECGGQTVSENGKVRFLNAVICK